MAKEELGVAVCQQVLKRQPRHCEHVCWKVLYLRIPTPHDQKFQLTEHLKQQVHSVRGEHIADYGGAQVHQDHPLGGLVHQHLQLAIFEWS